MNGQSSGVSNDPVAPFVSAEALVERLRLYNSYTPRMADIISIIKEALNAVSGGSRVPALGLVQTPDIRAKLAALSPVPLHIGPIAADDFVVKVARALDRAAQVERGDVAQLVRAVLKGHEMEAPGQDLTFWEKHLPGTHRVNDYVSGKPYLPSKLPEIMRSLELELCSPGVLTGSMPLDCRRAVPQKRRERIIVGFPPVPPRFRADFEHFEGIKTCKEEDLPPGYVRGVAGKGRIARAKWDREGSNNCYRKRMFEFAQTCRLSSTGGKYQGLGLEQEEVGLALIVSPCVVRAADACRRARVNRSRFDPLSTSMFENCLQLVRKDRGYLYQCGERYWSNPAVVARIPELANAKTRADKERLWHRQCSAAESVYQQMLHMLKSRELCDPGRGFGASLTPFMKKAANPLDYVEKMVDGAWLLLPPRSRPLSRALWIRNLCIIEMLLQRAPRMRTLYLMQLQHWKRLPDAKWRPEVPPSIDKAYQAWTAAKVSVALNRAMNVYVAEARPILKACASKSVQDGKLKEKQPDWLFLNCYGEQLRESGVSQAVRHITNIIFGISLNTHAFRSLLVIGLTERGEPVERVSKVVGYAVRTAEGSYSRPDIERRSASAIARYDHDHGFNALSHQ